MLLDRRVLGDLGTDNVGVVAELLLAFFFHVALLLLVLLLALNNPKEVIALSLSLGGKGSLTLVELSLAGNFKLIGLSNQLFLLGDLLSAGLSLTLFEGTLGS